MDPLTATSAPPAGEQTRARYPDREGFVERDGVRVHWESYGRGRPVILLLPSWSIPPRPRRRLRSRVSARRLRSRRTA